MINLDLQNKKKIYFIGIGGVGVSALANLLIKLEHQVCGSDIVENIIVKNLKKQGASINIGHSSDNISTDIDIVVVSSAASKENPEIKKAKMLGIPIIHRSEMLALMTKKNKVVAVAGSHGKTTTTSLISSVVEEGNYDPTVFIGGIWGNINSNAKLGNGDFAVIEADESDGSLLNYSPYIGVITNIEYEHVDYYKNLDHLINTFIAFTKNVPQDGLIIICEDDENCRNLKKHINSRVLTYGIKESADVVAKNIKFIDGRTCFDVYVKDNKGSYSYYGDFSIQKMGEHNVSNALASICVGIELEIEVIKMKIGLDNCQGVERRMEFMGEGSLFINNKLFNDLTIIQDYGHHPTEIISTTESLKQVYKKRIVTVFQPHRYSRTKVFLSEFCSVLSKSDYLLITDIYSGSEDEIEGFSVINLLQEFNKKNFTDYTYFKDYPDMEDKLSNVVKDGDMILFLGAGDIANMCKDLSNGIEIQGKKVALEK
jgi:UDP-N-acetylmuramate--alanine ligase